MGKIPKLMIRKLRNDIPIERIITSLQIPHKYSEGYFRFLCPFCKEFNTATKRETNLARCFLCERNYNPIDMVMACTQKNFLQTIEFLKPLLEYYSRTK
jgi:hypothetical protein